MFPGPVYLCSESGGSQNTLFIGNFEYLHIYILYVYIYIKDINSTTRHLKFSYISILRNPPPTDNETKSVKTIYN